MAPEALARRAKDVGAGRLARKAPALGHNEARHGGRGASAQGAGCRAPRAECRRLGHAGV